MANDGMFAQLPLVQDPAAREALKQVSQRLAKVQQTNFAVVTPASLTENMDFGNQRATGVNTPTQPGDLVTLGYVRGYVQTQADRLLKALQQIVQSSNP